jgi:hypothetical protein
LNKKAPNLPPYLDLFAEAPQREAAAEELFSWPRDSRMDPDSPAILYDFDLAYLLAIAGLNEPALELMTYVAKTSPRLLSRFRWDPALASFNCTPGVQAIYATLPFASSWHDDPCPASESDLP